jgi:hypothetical protein
MAQYLLELYTGRHDVAEVMADAARTRRAAAELTGEGTPVRYLHSIFVPEDETHFVLCEAGSADAARETARRAGLGAVRVVDAIS